MRPQDIAILLKIIALGEQAWQSKDLASSLFLSASEISESLGRSAYSGLFQRKSRQVSRLALLDFLIHGLRFVFPQQPGALAQGIPTAHSALPLKSIISDSGVPYVWPVAKGPVKGQAIMPLYPGAPAAALEDNHFYELLALVDALRVGRARDRALAREELQKRILHAPVYQS
ncbi:MAG: hypothetical protein IT447_16940 [Phycisphaerales bacterium]|nr:hypothetical protein [Phycisphaerales bacterium]